MLESPFSKVAGVQTPSQVFSCEFCKIFKSICFIEQVRANTSAVVVDTLKNNLKKSDLTDLTWTEITEILKYLIKKYNSQHSI